VAARVSTPSSIAAVRVPVKVAQGSELTKAQTTYNKVLRHVSLDPWRIGVITKATLVPLHVEHDRPLLGRLPA